MLRKALVLCLFVLLSACSSSPMDTPLTESNRQDIINQSMPEMSQQDQQTLMAFTARKMMEQMADEIASQMEGSAPAQGSMGDWDHLPVGKTINEILKEQRAFEAAN